MITERDSLLTAEAQFYLDRADAAENKEIEAEHLQRALSRMCIKRRPQAAAVIRTLAAC